MQLINRSIIAEVEEEKVGHSQINKDVFMREPEQLD
jgi:hypothetical protein